MNRIQQTFEETLDPSWPAPSLESVAQHDFEPTHPQDACHCIFMPKHYERNYAYPLVVWLHGDNDDERQVTRVMPHVSDRNYVAVGPRGTAAAVAPAKGFRWAHDADHVELAERRVMAAVRATRSWLNVAAARVFLAGYGAGGTMAFRLALARPDAFAGVLSLCGAFPTTLRPLARFHAARRTRIFLAAGREARQYREADVCRDLRLFHAAGMPLCLRLYPCGDDLTTTMLSDMDRWIMEQVSPQVVPRSEPSHRSRGK